jgi:hypothetical protein
MSQSDYCYAAATCATDTAEGVPVVMRRGDVWLASDRGWRPGSLRGRTDYPTVREATCGV